MANLGTLAEEKAFDLKVQKERIKDESNDWLADFDISDGLFNGKKEWLDCLSLPEKMQFVLNLNNNVIKNLHSELKHFAEQQESSEKVIKDLTHTIQQKDINIKVAEEELEKLKLQLNAKDIVILDLTSKLHNSVKQQEYLEKTIEYLEHKTNQLGINTETSLKEIEKLKLKLDEKDNIFSNLEKESSSLTKQLEKTVENLTYKVKQQNINIKNAENEIEELKIELDEKNDIILHSENKSNLSMKLKESLEKTISDLTHKARQQNINIKAAENEIEELKLELNEKDTVTSQLENDLNNLLKIQKSLEKIIEDLTYEVKQQNIDKEDLKNEIEILKSLLDEKEFTVSNSEDEIKDIETSKT